MEILFIILFIIGIFLYTKKEMLLIEKNIPMIALTILYIIFLISFSMNLNSTFFLDKPLVYMNGLPLFYGGSLINGTFVTHYLTYFLLFIPIGLMIPFYIYKHYSILTKFVVSTCLCLLLQAVLSISSALVPMLDVNMYISTMCGIYFSYAFIALIKPILKKGQVHHLSENSNSML